MHVYVDSAESWKDDISSCLTETHGFNSTEYPIEQALITHFTSNWSDSTSSGVRGPNKVRGVCGGRVLVKSRNDVTSTNRCEDVATIENKVHCTLDLGRYHFIFALANI